MSMRITSTNFNPALYWIYGCQLIALNYQTNDKWMQYYTAFFQQNRSCGYVLKPQVHVTNKFDS
jgi:phosphatidylinositol phospholipase C epsilon